MRFLADENLNGDLFRGLMRIKPAFDIVRAQDVGLRTLDDPIVLAWAAENGRILVTHDVATMVVYAYERVAANLPMPGVIEIPRRVTLAIAIQDLLFIDEASAAEEWTDSVIFLPL